MSTSLARFASMPRCSDTSPGRVSARLDRYGHLYDADLTAAADELGKAMTATAVQLRYLPDKKNAMAS